MTHVPAAPILPTSLHFYLPVHHSLSFLFHMPRTTFAIYRNPYNIDVAMQSSVESMQQIDVALSSLQRTFNPATSTYDGFADLSTKLHQLLEHNVKEHTYSLDAVRAQLRRLNEGSAPLSSDVRSSLTSARQRGLDAIPVS